MARNRASRQDIKLHRGLSAPACRLEGEVRIFMADKSTRLPPELPILPVRETVLFPGAVMPLTVGRESSLALLESLHGEEKVIGVVAQLDPRIE